VRLVVGDTGPLHYLVWIGHIDLVPKLVEKVCLPCEVRDELSRRSVASGSFLDRQTASVA
jgi:predicted nucleic acid-binding protein